MMYLGAGRLAIALGNLEEAERLADQCAFEAQRSGVWLHRVAALMIRSDLYVARKEHELAWPLIEEAVQRTGDRSHLLADAGAFGRLYRHFIWATEGYEAMTRIERQERGTYRRVTESLEIELFEESVATLEVGLSRPFPAFVKLQQTRLYGTLTRLLNAGIRHPAAPLPARGETSAQMVAREFLGTGPALVPSSVFERE